MTFYDIASIIGVLVLGGGVIFLAANANLPKEDSCKKLK